MKHVALLRGINVGTAKAISMAELAEVFRGLGFSEVTTLLRSGNVVFEAERALPPSAASEIEAAVFAATGVQSSVLVLDRDRFLAIAAADPLGDVATDGSKSFVTFLSAPLGDIELPDAEALLPEVLRLGDGAVYQWFPEGSLQSRVPKSFWKQFAAPVTARNANTVAKIAALLG
ncbi:DUF1697 domain-containing protein [Parafrigoribacterium soli]|uniref:DUF1697 domain-containing protein n=1 Tax=Parafrigoribacterium soli TaxID=3144663 RepID=UPI0032ECEE76